MLWFDDIQTGLCLPVCQHVLIQWISTFDMCIMCRRNRACCLMPQMQILCLCSGIQDKYNSILVLTRMKLHSKCLGTLPFLSLAKPNACCEVEVEVDVGSRSGLYLSKQGHTTNTLLSYFS